MAARAAEVGGGAFVLVATAWAAIMQFTQPGSTLAGITTGGALVALLLSGAWLLVRFAGRHGGEIGEARFDTRNKDEEGG